MERLPTAAKIAIALGVLALIIGVIAVLVLVTNGTIDEGIGRNLFAVFAILGGIGFIADAFKREGAPKALHSIAFKFTSLGFTLGLIVGDWGEYWWQLTLGGLAAGIIVAVIERAISKGEIPNRVFRLVVWNLVGVLAIGEGVYIILPV